MQSLSRALRRGSAVLVFNQITKAVEPVWRKNTTRERWAYAKRDKLEATADKYCEGITKPLTQKDILNARDKGVKNIFKLK
jgi:hypothetical protein